MPRLRVTRSSLPGMGEQSIFDFRFTYAPGVDSSELSSFVCPLVFADRLVEGLRVSSLNTRARRGLSVLLDLINRSLTPHSVRVTPSVHSELPFDTFFLYSGRGNPLMISIQLLVHQLRRPRTIRHWCPRNRLPPQFDNHRRARVQHVRFPLPSPSPRSIHPIPTVDGQRDVLVD